MSGGHGLLLLLLFLLLFFERLRKYVNHFPAPIETAIDAHRVWHNRLVAMLAGTQYKIPQGQMASAAPFLTACRMCSRYSHDADHDSMILLIVQRWLELGVRLKR